MSDILNLDASIRQLTNSTREKNIIIAGDFNCPDIDWPSLTVKPGAPDPEVQKALIDISIEHRLTQVHDQPTRLNNMLDLVFTNNPSLVKTSSSVPGISDHAMIVTDINIIPHSIKQKPRKIHIFSKANWENIKEDMKTLSNKIIHTNSKDNSSTEQLWELLKNDIDTSINKHVPSKTSKTRKSLPWLNRDLRRMTRRKSRLYKHAKKSKQWGDFKSYQKECKKAFKKAEINYINNTIQKGLDENNSKPFWRFVKSRRQDSVGVPPLKKMGRLVNTSKEKAQILVDQFRSVFTKEVSFVHPSKATRRYQNSIPPLIISTAGVEKLLLKINTAKAIGPDRIPNLLLKTCAKELAPAICTIFQSSIDTGKLPSDWRNAFVSPIYKKGDVHQAENYRPVSLTCVTCKLIEHIICKHILTYLEQHNILTSLNHGFRSGYSCETQLVTTVHDILSKTDSGTQLDIAILDFSKAFDTVPHRKLLHKLDNYGISGTINTWLEDFLTNRSMKVVVEGEESDPVTVDSGVPQGTVLGPLLFLCHINDLPESVKSSVRLFADDCLLYRPITKNQDQELLQQDLLQLERWADTWGMKFNAKKCYIMSINQKSSKFYQLGNHILQQVPENPYLGVTITQDLKWSSHITKITKKANSTLGFLRRNLKHCPQDCRRTAYLSLVRSTLEYSSILWDPYHQKDVDSIEKVQRQAARFITGNYQCRTPGCITDMLQDLKLPSLQDRRKANRLIFFYKVVEGLVPALPCHDYLTPVRKNKRKVTPKTFSDYSSTNIVENQSINNSKCFTPVQTKTLKYKNSFFPRTILDWNKLEDSVVCATTVNSFRTAVLHWD